MERRADEACLAAFGEAFRLVPMVKPPSGRTQPDPTRQIIDNVRGLYRAPGRLGAFSTSREAMETGKGVGVQGSAPGVGIRTEGLAWLPRQHDRVVRIKTGKTYTIIKAEPFGASSLDLILAEVSA